MVKRKDTYLLRFELIQLQVKQKLNILNLIVSKITNDQLVLVYYLPSLKHCSQDLQILVCAVEPQQVEVCACQYCLALQIEKREQNSSNCKISNAVNSACLLLKSL